VKKYLAPANKGEQKGGRSRVAKGEKKGVLLASSTTAVSLFLSVCDDAFVSEQCNNSLAYALPGRPASPLVKSLILSPCKKASRIMWQTEEAKDE
jgi:hypothetical protein